MINNTKRLLESPEGSTQPPKVIRINTSSVMLTSEPTTSNPSNTTSSQTKSTDILEAIRSAVADEFKKFKDEHIQPIAKDLEVLKSQLEDLKKESESDKDRISLLERELKQKNLIFTKIPQSNDMERSIMDLCSGTLGLGTTLTVEKTVILKSNTADNSSTVLATFGSIKAVDAVLKNVRKLKGTKIGVSKDLSMEERLIKKQLLSLRRALREKHASLIIKVYGNQMIIDEIKFTKSRTYFGNKHRNINARDYILEKYGIDCNEINTQ